MITVSFKRSAFLALIYGSLLGLSGCVAAAIPILAAGAIVKRTVDLEKDAGLTKGSQYTAKENDEPLSPLVLLSSRDLHHIAPMQHRPS